MTKKEVADENKNSEGDPMIRAMRRSPPLAMGRNRMIAAVTGADVVLLNPTHIAVALKSLASSCISQLVSLNVWPYTVYAISACPRNLGQ